MMIRRDDDKKIKGTKRIKDKSSNFLRLDRGPKHSKFRNLILLALGNFIRVQNFSALDLSKVGFWIVLLPRLL